MLDLEQEHIKDRTHRVIVPATHQTYENAAAPRKAKLVLYLVSAIYHYVHLIVYSCAILGRMRVVSGEGSRWTKIGVNGKVQDVCKREAAKGRVNVEAHFRMTTVEPKRKLSTSSEMTASITPMRLR